MKNMKHTEIWKVNNILLIKLNMFDLANCLTYIFPYGNLEIRNVLNIPGERNLQDFQMLKVYMTFNKIHNLSLIRNYF